MNFRQHYVNELNARIARLTATIKAVENDPYPGDDGSLKEGHLDVLREERQGYQTEVDIHAEADQLEPGAVDATYDPSIPF